jgi:hypothetical protein
MTSPLLRREAAAVCRRHGRIQLQVLDFLYRSVELSRFRGEQIAFVPVIDIAGHGASRSRIESVRRATKSLADEGLLLLELEDASRAPERSGSRSVHLHEADLMARLATSSDRR